ncbi:NUMOD4 domain-containing protein [Pseudonocardia sp. MH-G8]|uniref:NUMOD4 domain-containing protein n=1 Tax=Pseudonocardia sp. MH-G8 TaxID=1854588 RepID=UPI0018E9EBC8|nr:NUMOD4 domain-containing protein [Pseudonocardia sp. MH-G8]
MLAPPGTGKGGLPARDQHAGNRPDPSNHDANHNVIDNNTVAVRQVQPVERWAAVPSYEGLYEVSDRSRVRSLDREVVDRNGRPMRLRGRDLVAVDGRVRPYRDGRGRTVHVAALVRSVWPEVAR